MNFFLYWLYVPAPIRELVWIGVAAFGSYLAWKSIAPGRARVACAIAVFLTVYGTPDAFRFTQAAIADYEQEKDAWLRSMCKDLSKSWAPSNGYRPLQVEGVLDQTNYDQLLNDRFQRAAQEMEHREGRDGGFLRIDTGRYKPHLIFQAMRGGTFAAIASTVLIGERFSFVEFEMRQEDGKFTNSSSMDTKSWPGTKYRRYFLAPMGHPACFWDGFVRYTAAGASIGGVVHPYCVALEIGDRSLARYRIVGDETKEWHRWTGKIRGVSLPFWTGIRWDRITLLDGAEAEAKVLDRKLAFSYPSEIDRRYECGSLKAPNKLVEDWFVARFNREFFREKKWYAGSEVQRFYEGSAAIVQAEPGAVPAANASRFQGEAKSPFVHSISEATDSAVIRSVPPSPENAMPVAPPLLDPEPERALKAKFDEAIEFQLRGDVVAARDKYLEVLKLDPERDSAKSNLKLTSATIQRADAAAKAFDVAITKGDKSAQTLANRGRAYLGAGDVGRGVRDMERAKDLRGADEQIWIDLALAYIGANQPENAIELASKTIQQFPPAAAKAYEIRAWSSLLQKNGESAVADANASLGPIENWTIDSFRHGRAGYRVLAGYFGLRQMGSDARAKAELRNWQKFASRDNWPDAMIFHVLGQLPESEVKAIAELHAGWDEKGTAPAECAAFLALNDILEGRPDIGRQRLYGDFSRYGAGRSLGLTIRSRAIKRTF